MSTMKGTFAERLYVALPAEGNVFFSPFSVRSALGRAAVGARGNTRKEMLELLGLDDQSDEGLVRQIASLESIHGLPDVTIEIANRIYAEISYHFRREYMELMERFAGIEMVDFRSAFEQVRADINNWVAEKTHDRIKDLLTPGSLDAMTRMVLVNAIYFKGKWQYEFDPQDTRDDDFTLASGQKNVKVKMMYQQNSAFRYACDDAMQILQMPYKGGRLARLVMLPNKGVSLRSVEQLMAERGIQSVVGSLRRLSDLHVYVPKFEVGWGTFNMTATLDAMGMKDAFTNRAIFSGMEQDDSRDLYISGVYHKAWIKDDEEGSEAAAATVVVMRSKGISLKPQMVFRADHPFVYMILDMENNNPLFIGRMADPNK